MSGRSTFGFILIALGSIIILNYYQVTFFADWWPILLVALGAFLLVKHPKSPVSGTIIITLGAILQARKLDLLPAEIIIPIILIILGIMFIFTRFKGKSAIHHEEQLSHFVIFSGLETRNQAHNFKGGSVTAIFGGASIDLRDAVLSQEGAELELSAAFGGIELRVPEDWVVVATGLPLFGGWENKAQFKTSDGARPVLKINCLALFGGVEIKN